MNEYDNLLEIVIPTYNRPECIKYGLNFLEKYFEDGYKFSITIFDSSTNDKTYDIIKNYPYENLVYQRFNPDIDVDEKTILALKSARSKYVMLLGDGYVVDIEKIFNQIDLVECESEVILLYDPLTYNKNFYNKIKNIYFDKDEFFKVNFFRLTTYGASLCLNRVIQQIDDDDVISKFNKSGFIYPCALSIYSSGPYEVKFDNFLYPIPYKKYSGWIQNKSAVKIWTKNLQKSLSQLENSLSNDAINEIIKSRGKFDSFFTAKGLIKLRCTDNFNLKILKQYKSYLYKSLYCHKVTAYFIAIMPKFIAQFIYNIFKKRKSKDSSI